MSTESHSVRPPETIAADLLEDVGEIAAFYYGADTPQNRARIYQRASKNIAKEKRLPVFRDGKLIKARKSRLLQWIVDQENGIN